MRADARVHKNESLPVLFRLNVKPAKERARLHRLKNIRAVRRGVGERGLLRRENDLRERGVHDARPETLELRKQLCEVTEREGGRGQRGGRGARKIVSKWVQRSAREEMRGEGARSASQWAGGSAQRAAPRKGATDA